MSKGRLIVGVGGQFDNGKDTLADRLAATLNGMSAHGGRPEVGVWHRNAFAAGVKRVFCETFGVDLEWVEKWKRIDSPPPGFLKTVRQMLIDIGDGFRSFREDVWIRRAMMVPGSVIISDARYQNEMRAIRDEGGTTVLVWMPGKENDNPNRSEQDLMEYVRRFKAAGVRGPTGDPLIHYFCVNDGTREDLFREADGKLVPFILARLGLAQAASAPAVAA